MMASLQRGFVRCAHRARVLVVESLRIILCFCFNCREQLVLVRFEDFDFVRNNELEIGAGT
jgi:hypothetical protein